MPGRTGSLDAGRRAATSSKVASRGGVPMPTTCWRKAVAIAERGAVIVSSPHPFHRFMRFLRLDAMHNALFCYSARDLMSFIPLYAQMVWPVKLIKTHVQHLLTATAMNMVRLFSTSDGFGESSSQLQF